MKKRVLSLMGILCCFLLLTNKSAAEVRNIRIEDLCYYDRSGGTTSIAATDQYVVYAKGTFSDNYYLEWTPNEFTISIEYVSTGEEIEIVTFPSSWVSVLSDGEMFYITESNFMNENIGSPFFVRVGLLVPETREIYWIESFLINEEEYEILDVQLIHNKLYLIFSQHILQYDPQTTCSSTIYETEYELINDLYDNHAQVYQDQLIVQTDRCLLSVDVITGDVNKLVCFDIPSSSYEYDDCRATNAYYVSRNILIFASSGQMNALDLVTGKIAKIFDEEFKIFQALPNGMYVDLCDWEYNVYFYSALNTLAEVPLDEFNMRDILIDLAKNR